MRGKSSEKKFLLLVVILVSRQNPDCFAKESGPKFLLICAAYFTKVKRLKGIEVLVPLEEALGKSLSVLIPARHSTQERKRERLLLWLGWRNHWCDGNLEVLNGNFWSVGIYSPAIQQLESKLSLGKPVSG